MPKRIQLSRRKGYRKPADAVVVSRPGPFGNPFRLLPGEDRDVAVNLFAQWMRDPKGVYVDRWWGIRDRLSELRGKDLACWCPLGEPCHGDVLLELANGPIDSARKGASAA
jgi:hypothetical protein